MDPQTLQEKYDISTEDMSALGTPVDPRRKKIVVGAIVFAIVLAATLVLRINAAVPEVSAAIARDNIAQFEKTANVHIASAKVLTGRLFDLMTTLLTDNPPFQKMRGHWQNASKQIDVLQTDLGLLGDQPIDAGKRLVQNGPARVRAIVQHTAAVVAETQNFLPQILAGLQGAKDAFTETESGMEAMIAGLDALFLPLIAGDETLQASWDSWRSDFRGWVTNVTTDIKKLRKRIDGDHVSREFASRLFSEVLGF